LRETGISDGRAGRTMVGMRARRWPGKKTDARGIERTHTSFPPSLYAQTGPAPPGVRPGQSWAPQLRLAEREVGLLWRREEREREERAKPKKTRRKKLKKKNGRRSSTYPRKKKKTNNQKKKHPGTARTLRSSCSSSTTAPRSCTPCSCCPTSPRSRRGWSSTWDG
jgi:hypothetical protein